VLKEAGRLDESASVSQREAVAEVRGYRASASREAVAKATRAIRRAREARGASRRRLVLYCRRSYSGERADKPGSWEWGPHAKERGIGGSESAVISMSRELAALGWGVEVYASPPEADVGVDEHGVMWAPFWAYGMGGARGSAGEHDEVEAFVAWRFAEAMAVGVDARRRYLWLHDEVHNFTLTPCAMRHFESGGGIFVLSKFHRSQLPDFALGRAILTSNGLDDTAMADGANRNDKFIYASTPSAGLHLLLSMWEKVRSALPDATLDVYYGFWPYAMWAEQAMRPRSG